MYLAQQGHYVDAFDLSEYGIAKLKHICELSNVQVNAFAADLTTYHFEQCLHPNVPKRLHASNKNVARKVK